MLKLISRLACARMLLMVGVPLCGLHANVSAQEKAGPDFPIYKDAIKQLLSVVTKQTPVAVLRFQSDTKEVTTFVNGKAERATVSASSALRGTGGKVFLMKGVFKLEAELNGPAPQVGPVDGAIASHRRDPSAKNSWFDPSLPRKSERITSILCLAVWPGPKSAVLDATFFGPVSERDVKQLIELAALLKKQPPSELSKEKAEALLESPNAWIAYLGLLRLEDTRALSRKHFTQMLKSLPAQNTPAVTADMFRWVLASGGGKKEMAPTLAEVFGNLDAEKEVLFIKTFSGNWHLHPRNMQFEVNLPELQAAAKEYRARIQNDPTRREVVQELNKLIDLREKVK